MAPEPKLEIDTSTQRAWAIQVDELWRDVACLMHGTRENRLSLGQRFRELRSLYSDRNCGGNRLTSGHGTFELEIGKRGYKPRTVRQWIEDYEAALAGRPFSAAKRKARRLHRAVSSPLDPLAQFAALLPFKVLVVAYREAAKVFHPDHGGNAAAMTRLNEVWQRLKERYSITLEG